MVSTQDIQAFFLYNRAFKLVKIDYKGMKHEDFIDFINDIKLELG